MPHVKRPIDVKPARLTSHATPATIPRSIASRNKEDRRKQNMVMKHACKRKNRIQTIDGKTHHEGLIPTLKIALQKRGWRRVNIPDDIDTWAQSAKVRLEIYDAVQANTPSQTYGDGGIRVALLQEHGMFAVLK